MSSQSLYDKAVRSYLLTKYTSAANTCNKAIQALKPEDDESLKLNIWTLYLNIASTLLVGSSTLPPAKLFGLEETNVDSVQDVCHCIWNKLVQSYSTEPVDARLVTACLNLDLKLNQMMEAREVAESWFASLSDLVLDDIANSRESDESYLEIVQLYTCHVLPGMNDFDSANTFLEYNSVLSDSKKKQLKSIIQEQQDIIEKEKKKLEEEAVKSEIAKAEEAIARAKAEAEEKAEAEAAAIEAEKIKTAKALAEKEEKDREDQAELSKKEKILEIKSHSTVSTPRSINQPSVMDHNLKLIKKWMAQITTKSAASYATILIIVFALLALLRGQRGRLSIALQSLMAKLWQTIKMGTKVTYM